MFLDLICWSLASCAHTVYVLGEQVFKPWLVEFILEK